MTWDDFIKSALGKREWERIHGKAPSEMVRWLGWSWVPLSCNCPDPGHYLRIDRATKRGKT